MLRTERMLLEKASEALEGIIARQQATDPTKQAAEVQEELEYARGLCALISDRASELLPVTSDGGFVVVIDLGFNPDKHGPEYFFVVCNREGEWMLANGHHPYFNGTPDKKYKILSTGPCLIDRNGRAYFQRISDDGYLDLRRLAREMRRSLVSWLANGGQGG